MVARYATNCVISVSSDLRDHLTQFLEPRKLIVIHNGVDTKRVSSELSLSEAKERLGKLEDRCPFDLANDLMIRALLVKISDDDHMLILTLHHIASDGWSLGVLFRELMEFYRAYLTGDTPELSELPIQYADFACWHRDWLKGEVLESQLSYWKEQLAGCPEFQQFPTDHPRPPQQTYRGARERVYLPANLTASLKALSQMEGVSLFMALLAGFQALLHRYTGQDDIVVGSPIANRNRLELEGIIGFFVNTLVLRTDVSGNPSCRELLGRVRDIALSAYDHQDFPFEKTDRGHSAGAEPQSFTHVPGDVRTAKHSHSDAGVSRAQGEAGRA